MKKILLVTAVIILISMGCTDKDGGSSPSSNPPASTSTMGATFTITQTATITQTVTVTPTITATQIPSLLLVDDFNDGDLDSSMMGISSNNWWGSAFGSIGSSYAPEIVAAPSGGYGAYSLGITFTATANSFNGSAYEANCGYGVQTYSVYPSDGYDFSVYTKIHFSLSSIVLDPGTATNIMYVIRVLDTSSVAVEYTVSGTVDGTMRDFFVNLSDFVQVGIKPWDEVFADTAKIFIKFYITSANSGDTGQVYILFDSIYFD